MAKAPTSYRISDEAKELLAEIARLRQMTVVTTLEVIIREAAWRLGIGEKQSGQDESQPLASASTASDGENSASVPR